MQYDGDRASYLATTPLPFLKGKNVRAAASNKLRHAVPSPAVRARLQGRYGNDGPVLYAPADAIATVMGQPRLGLWYALD